MTRAGTPDPPLPAAGEILRTAEAAAMLGVEPRTVTDWARAGLLPSFRTPGGRLRYWLADVRAVLDRETPP